MGFVSANDSDLHVTWMDILAETELWDTAEF